MPERARRRRGAAALWLVADAAVAGIFPGLAEALLLFVLTPDRPLTLGGYLAALVALSPQILGAFVLLGPALVLAGRALAVGRFTRRGLSRRYILRFALLDALLIGAAAAHQYRSLGGLLPPQGRVALALVASSTLAAAGVLALLAALDLRREGSVGGPWLAAVALGFLVALGVAASLRRVQSPDPVPVDLPGFEAERTLLVVEMPGWTAAELARHADRGDLRAVARLAATGTLAEVAGPPPADPLALHATLATGQPPRVHALFGQHRYRPLWDRRSFAVLPRGLLLAPLLGTRLWVRVPVAGESLRAVALPGIARGLGLKAAVIGDPLAWREPWCVPAARLGPGREIPLPGGGSVTCPDPGDLASRYFQTPAERLQGSRRLAGELRNAFAADACAIEIAARALAAGVPIVHVRLAGHGRAALRFAGFRPESRARATGDREVAAYRHVLRRYRHDLDERLAPLVDEILRGGGLAAIVSPFGVRPRQDPLRLVEPLLGLDRPTATLAGPVPGALLLAGPGVGRKRAPDRPVPLVSVLPTLLWALGLPVAEDAGAVAFELFEPEFRAAHPVVTVPSFDARRAGR